MTREEKIEMLETEKAYMIAHGGDRQAEALTSAIQVLEQEPCEDCISREKVCDYIAEFVNHEYATDRECEMVEHIIGGIQHLSSVQPKPKTGHWKFIQRGKFIDICCSECGYVSVKDYAYNYTINQLDEQEKKDFFAKAHMNFCECCGVKMSESEDKE